MSAEIATHPSWNRVLIAASIVAVAVFLVLYFPERNDPSGAVVGGIFALCAAALGVAAVTRVRPLRRRTTGREIIRSALVALGVGVLLGAANLGANYRLAMLSPTIYEQMLERWAQYSPWSMVIAEPLLEEIGFRLFLMGGVAWVASRVTDSRRVIFWVALGISALLFGLIHIVGRPPMPVSGAIGLTYSSGVVLKSTAAGVVLGWVFWRWGLLTSFACHGMANAVHMVLTPTVF